MTDVVKIFLNVDLTCFAGTVESACALIRDHTVIQSHVHDFACFSTFHVSVAKMVSAGLRQTSQAYLQEELVIVHTV